MGRWPAAKELARTGELLTSLCEERIFASGGQISVMHENILVDAAFGEKWPGAPMASDLLFNVHCATKPVAAATLIAIMDEKELAPETTVGSIVEPNSGLSGCGIPVEAVLNHSAGLGYPSLLEASLLPRTEARGLAVASALTPSKAGYSEFVFGVLVSELISGLSDGPSGNTVQERTCVPLGLGADIWLMPVCAISESWGLRSANTGVGGVGLFLLTSQ